MLTKRIIPCLDVKEGRVVKGVNFVNLIDAGDPVELASAYDKSGADEVVFLDITATHEARKTTIKMASRAAEELHIPFAVGGGFVDIASIREMIAAGADKVSLNSAAVKRPELLSEAASAFGTQAVICAIDAKRVTEFSDDTLDAPETLGASGASGTLDTPRWTVYVHGGRIDTGIDAIEWAIKAAEYGAGEILLTSMDRDGSKDGYDLSLTRAVSDSVNIPVIASGGVGKIEHFSEGVIEGGAEALLAASVFHFGELSISQVKEDMHKNGIPVRRVS